MSEVLFKTKSRPAKCKKNEIIKNIDRVILFLFGILFLFFPLLFSTITTEAFVLPKQVALITIVLISLVLLGVKLIAQGQIKLRRTPFDLPLILFTLFVVLSSAFSVNRADALTALVPFVVSVLVFFILTNTVKSASQFHLLIVTFLLGAFLTSIWTLLTYFKIYPLSLPIAQSPSFTPLGAGFDLALYLLFALPLGIYLSKKEVPHMRSKSILQAILFPVASLVIVAALVLSVYQIVKPTDPTAKLYILPAQNGIATAFSAISQDSGRTIQGLLLGSGYGTFITDFTRFKSSSFNNDDSLWFITFFRSSSFVLEILATVGVLGVAAYIFLIIRILATSSYSKKGGLFLAVLIPVIASFILPLSFNIQTVLFIILTLYALHLGLFGTKGFFDVELDLVALRKGLFEVNSDGSARKGGKVLPVVLFLVILGFCLFIGFWSVRYVMADILFQKSLIAASANKGVDTYNDEVNAIQLFPYRDGFYRIYSQTNLTLANTIAAAQTQGSKPNPQTQQTVYTLIQQSINAGRSATTIAPLTYLNWENLASVYRSLIGFGQNADNFALISEQQAVTLDPNDPQVYINLGGIYFQVGKYDDAKTQFQQAVNLKPNYANAHYNLGHAMESKGDLQGALGEYQTVETLVSGNPTNSQKIQGEIDALNKKISSQASTQTPTTPASDQSLGISKPSTQLPAQHPPVSLPTPTP